jgi:hypothetical protein
MKKKFGFVVAAAFTCIVSAAAALYANADLSGEWTLNNSKSELGEWGERIAPKKLTISGDASAISVSRTVMSPEGAESPLTEKMTFDGKQTESVMFGNTKKKASAKWSDDGKTMNVDAVILLDNNGEQVEIKVKEAWSLGADGKTLLLNSTSNSQWGESTMKLVYDKTK